MRVSAMPDNYPGLENAYAMKTPDDSRRLYGEWAGTYDDDFVAVQRYRLPILVAEVFHAAGGEGPILDVRAGTGLCGLRFAQLGVGPIDGVDIAPEMLAVTAEKRVYFSFF